MFFGDHIGGHSHSILSTNLNNDVLLEMENESLITREIKKKTMGFCWNDMENMEK